MSDLTLPGLAAFWARFRPSEIAVSDSRSDLTWRALNAEADQVADALTTQGARPGDIIAILMPNCAEYIVAVLAIMRTGAAVAPLNPRLTTAELRLTAQNAGLSAIFVGATMMDHAPAFEGLCRVIECDPERTEAFADLVVGSGPEGSTPVDLAPDAPAFVCYTSGTDGLPKGVVLTHRNVHTAAVQRLAIEGFCTESRILLPTSLAYTGGLVVSFAELTLHSGGRLYITDRFDPEWTARLVAQARITHMNVASPIMERIADLVDTTAADVLSLRSVCIGGTTVTERTLEICLRQRIPVAPSYGQSECAGGATFLPFCDLERKLGTSGQALMLTQLRLRSDDGRVAPAGDVGEIEIRSAAVMPGYWRDPGASAGVLRDGWLTTGDLGVLDEDGYLSVVGRKKQVIISGGLNIYPAELERVYSSLPEIETVVVVGVEDSTWGQVPLLVVQPRRGAEVDISMIRDLSAKFLADYKRPRFMVVRQDAMPVTTAGKVARSKIAAEYRLTPPDAISLM